MNVLALVVVALVQLVSLDLPQLRETIEAITTALVDQYVEPVEGALRRERTGTGPGETRPFCD